MLRLPGRPSLWPDLGVHMLLAGDFQDKVVLQGIRKLYLKRLVGRTYNSNHLARRIAA